jgi:hypothetical protein
LAVVDMCGSRVCSESPAVLEAQVVENRSRVPGKPEVSPALQVSKKSELAPGFVWDGCFPIPGLRYIQPCEGVGTNFLHAVVGTGSYATGLSAPCRNSTQTLTDPEEARTEVPAANPVATQILNETRFADLNNQLKAFRRDICTKTTPDALLSYAADQGRMLWDNATRLARDPSRTNDDRGLYWTRLLMVTDIRRFVGFPIDKTNAITLLERASRGMTSDTFDRGTAKKVFVSGFDPFALDGTGQFRGNTSGASVLPLDNQLINGAEVEVVIFPVRFADFDNLINGDGLVERVFKPHLPGGADPATMITTVSQGSDFGSSFDLEFYNGRRRSADFPDNQNMRMGTRDAPVIGRGLDTAGLPEFVQTTLPVEDMVQANAVVDTKCVEKPGGGASVDCVGGEGPRVGVNTIAVEGSGGGFLSNEIAYRVTRLRDAMNLNLPVGHIHTPNAPAPSGPGDPGYGAIITGFPTLLERAVGATPRAPIQLTADKAQYKVGETPAYVVRGPANATIKWTSTKNGTLTAEVDRIYTTPLIGPTDATGTWIGQGDRAWETADVGRWVKYVRVNGRLASVAFDVVP